VRLQECPHPMAPEWHGPVGDAPFLTASGKPGRCTVQHFGGISREEVSIRPVNRFQTMVRILL